MLPWTGCGIETLLLTIAPDTCADTGLLLHVMGWDFMGGVGVVVVSEEISTPV